MKIRCPDCKEKFQIDTNEYDDGDYLNCPECNLEMTVILEKGKIKLKATREKELDEESEFDEYFDD